MLDFRYETSSGFAGLNHLLLRGGDLSARMYPCPTGWMSGTDVSVPYVFSEFPDT
ncbi:MAG: hypothetical protein IJK60_00465 [Clostridia bacterium]|nr:hypothetical protein [Clostridia bacterium]